MIRVAIEFDLSADDLDEVALTVETLRTRAATAGAQPSATAPVADWKIADWLGHLGEGSRSFWNIAARHAQSNPSWTFDDLAQASGIDKETLRSYHRNSYRAIRDESAPDPLASEWDATGAFNVYRMPDVVRDEILRLA